MNCKTIEKRIDAYVDGELSGADNHSLEAHLHECGSCRALLQRAQALAFTERHEAPISVKSRAHAAFTSAAKTRSRPNWTMRIAVSFVSALPVCGIAFLLAQPRVADAKWSDVVKAMQGLSNVQIDTRFADEQGNTMFALYSIRRKPGETGFPGGLQTSSDGYLEWKWNATTPQGRPEEAFVKDIVSAQTRSNSAPKLTRSVRIDDKMYPAFLVPTQQLPLGGRFNNAEGMWRIVVDPETMLPVRCDLMIADQSGRPQVISQSFLFYNLSWEQEKAHWSNRNQEALGYMQPWRPIDKELIDLG